MKNNIKFEQTFNRIMLLENLPRSVKTLLLIVSDLVSSAFAFYVSFSLAAERLESEHGFLLALLFALVSLGGLLSVSIYRAVIRFSGVQVLELIGIVQLVAVIVVAVVTSFFYGELNVTLFLLLFLLSVFLLGGSRLAAREIMHIFRPSGKRILIYGAKKAGAQLLTSLRQDSKYDVLGFVADEEHLHGSRLHGVTVFPSSRLCDIVEEKKISIVALAMPNASRETLRNILIKLEPLSVFVKTLPKISNLLDDKDGHEQLQEIKFEELLGRDRVAPNEGLMRENITNKVVLVTGAGGSIGSELCRQIVSRRPKKLILVELSELALFNIEQELKVGFEGLIKPILASVCEFDLMRDLMVLENVQTVYHAAAYKHVPLVEINPFSAISNNVLGTRSILDASVASGVSSFTLVSTDKAVRPTNVMGASKRLAEILCQVSSAVNGNRITVSMVRFGNVIGSSGSAIPKFRSQIRAGGPVTITHPEITRYFMVIPEAAELVLQASSLAKGGEVFVLDMGSPIKITDLVKKLIRFSGNFFSDGQAPEIGGINVEYTGLRPGEKLYEELLISGDIESTDHPKIKKINEDYPSSQVFERFLDELKHLFEDRNEVALRNLLSRQGLGYVAEGTFFKDSGLAGTQSKTFDEEQVPDVNGRDFSNHEMTKDFVQNENKGVGGYTKKGVHKASLSKRIFLSFLHKYFLFSRPLTMGGRCVIVNEDNEIYLVEHSYISGWYLPGGGVAVGESAENAIKREVTEETVLVLTGLLQLVGVYHCNSITERYHVVVFLSKTFETNRSQIESFEIKSGRFFSINSLPPDIDSDSKGWIFDALELESRA